MFACPYANLSSANGSSPACLCHRRLSITMKTDHDGQSYSRLPNQERASVMFQDTPDGSPDSEFPTARDSETSGGQILRKNPTLRWSETQTLGITDFDEERNYHLQQVLSGKYESDSSKVCQCGSQFMEDSVFCRKCGRRRERQRHVVLDIDPHHAMKFLLQHVKVDPDGGILNLQNLHTGQQKQHSKVYALSKGPLEAGLAIFAFVRTIGNPLIVFFFAGRLLLGYIHKEPWILEVARQVSQRDDTVPILEMFLITSATEVLLMGFLVLRALRHAVEALFCTREVEDPHQLHPRYLKLAQLFWHDIPYLQTSSALTPLGLVHPNLITKNTKIFSISEDLARAKLVKFLKFGIDKEQDLNDDDLSRRVVGLIANYDYKDKGEERIKFASDNLDISPYRALSHLQQSSLAKDKEYLESQQCNPEAIFGIQYKLVLWSEKFFFFMLACFCLATGSMAMFVKISRFFCMYTNPEYSLIFPVMYFLAFLNQTTGIVALSRLLSWRIEVFLFGGSDASVSSEENFIMQVYLGCLVEAVWHNPDMSLFQKFCVMFQLDDDDLQQLVIEDAAYQKATLLLQIRRYMTQHGNHGLLKTFVTKYAS